MSGKKKQEVKKPELWEAALGDAQLAVKQAIEDLKDVPLIDDATKRLVNALLKIHPRIGQVSFKIKKQRRQVEVQVAKIAARKTKLVERKAKIEAQLKELS